MKRKQQHPNIIHNLNEHLRLAFVALVLVALSACATNKTPQPNELTPAGAKRFDQADANHDGKLSRNEVSDYLVIEIFDSRDANHDGKMTMQEWTGGDPSRAADFKKRDANHDGIVTKQEAIAYGRAHGVANEIMKEADTNHDGYLERSEVKAYYASREGPPN
jgi:Ca2+-binding EF-hand superfamily protein